MSDCDYCEHGQNPMLCASCHCCGSDVHTPVPGEPDDEPEFLTQEWFDKYDSPDKCPRHRAYASTDSWRWAHGVGPLPRTWQPHDPIDDKAGDSK